MTNLIISIVIYLIALILSSVSYFTSKDVNKRTKLILLILVAIAAIFGIMAEINKYSADTDQTNKINALIAQNNNLGNSYKNLNSNYSQLNENYKGIKTVLFDSHLYYDSITKTLININTGTAFINPKNVNTGTNLGNQQIGDNNTQNITEPKPREVSQELINNVKKYAPDKNTIISLYRRSQDAETLNFATKIQVYLTKMGYKNVWVNGYIGETIVGGNPIENAKKLNSINYEQKEGELDIYIPSNK